MMATSRPNDESASANITKRMQDFTRGLERRDPR